MRKLASEQEIIEKNLELYHMLRDMDKTAESTVNNFLRAQIYEDSIEQKIIPQKPMTWSQLQRDEVSPDSYYIEDKEFVSAPAVVVDMRGASAGYQYIETDRYRITPNILKTDLYEIKEIDVKQMRQPLMEVLKTQIAFHLRKKKDALMLGSMVKAVNNDPSVQILDLTGTGITMLTPEVIAAGKNILAGRGKVDGKYITPTRMLITTPTYNNISAWTQTQSSLAQSLPAVYTTDVGQDFWTEGFKGNRLQGLDIMTTIKTDIFEDRYVWFLSSPDIMGKNFTFNDEKIYVERSMDSINVMGMTTHMSAIGNSYSLGLVILDSL